MATDHLAVQLSKLRQPVQMFASARVLWDERLSAAEQESLGGDLEAAWSHDNGFTTGMWRLLYGGSEEAATVAIAELLGLISSAHAKRLLEEIGEPIVAYVKPHWDGKSRELWYGSKIIKQVTREDALNVIAILAAFQVRKWPRTIADPLEPTGDAVRLAAAVLSLNRKLQEIKFHTKGGNSIYWEPVAI